MILFGVSNMISDIYECAGESGKRITEIVLNVPEQMRERTKDLGTRLRELNEQPKLLPLEEFAPVEGEEYFVVPITQQKSVLIEMLVRKYQLQFSNLVHPTAYISPYASMGQGFLSGPIA